MASRRLLVIDDRDERRAQIEQALASDGWLVRTSTEPEAASRLARTFQPSTILLAADRASVVASATAALKQGPCGETPLVVTSPAPHRCLAQVLEAGAALVLPLPLDAAARERLRDAPTGFASSASVRLFRSVRDCGLDGTVFCVASAGPGWARFIGGTLVDASFAGYSGAEAVVAMLSARIHRFDFACADEPVEEIDAELLVEEGPVHPWELAA